MALVLERTVLGKPRFSLWDSLLANLILALLQIQLSGHLFTRLLPKTWSANQQGTTKINKPKSNKSHPLCYHSSPSYFHAYIHV